MNEYMIVTIEWSGGYLDLDSNDQQALATFLHLDI